MRQMPSQYGKSAPYRRFANDIHFHLSIMSKATDDDHLHVSAVPPICQRHSPSHLHFTEIYRRRPSSRQRHTADMPTTFTFKPASYRNLPTTTIFTPAPYCRYANDVHFRVCTIP